MSFLFNKRILLAGLIAVSPLAQAQLEKGFTVTPSVGHYHMDSKRNVKNNTALSLGLGYQFGNRWAAELVYLNADTEAKVTKADVAVNQFRLDALYHLDETSKFTPYLAAGIGVNNFSPATKNAHLNAGAGVKYAFNQQVALRADFRLVDDFKDHRLDNITTLGLHVRLGSKSAPLEATKPAPAPVAPAPVVVVKEVTPEEPVAQVVVEPVNLNIKFANDSAVIDKEYFPKIKAVGSYLVDNPEAKILVEGHTDSRGAASYNKVLSEKRAQAVANVLVNELDIDASRISTVGYGEERPLATNDTEAGRQINRRVVTLTSSN